LIKFIIIFIKYKRKNIFKLKHILNVYFDFLNSNKISYFAINKNYNTSLYQITQTTKIKLIIIEI